LIDINTEARSKRSNASLTHNCGPFQTFHRYASFQPFQSFKTFHHCAPFNTGTGPFKTFQSFHRFAPFQTLKIEDRSKVQKQIRRGNFHVSGIRETSK
jgi:hypothetical protein